MDTETLKAMADRLQELADGAEPADPLGICYNIANEFGHDSLNLIKEEFCDWPEFSGDSHYPVPAPEHRLATPKDYFEFMGFDLWSGEYGAARRRLCGFLAQKIREEIGE